MFLHWMPTPWLEMTVLEATNESLKNAKEPEMMMPELYVFFGLWLLMATVVWFSHRDFFISRDYDEEDFPCPYCLDIGQESALFSTLGTKN